MRQRAQVGLHKCEAHQARLLVQPSNALRSPAAALHAHGEFLSRLWSRTCSRTDFWTSATNTNRHIFVATPPHQVETQILATP